MNLTSVKTMIVNCSYDVPILICFLRYSSLSLLPSFSLPLSHVSVAMTVKTKTKFCPSLYYTVYIVWHTSHTSWEVSDHHH